jgi:hypothetical protein
MHVLTVSIFNTTILEISFLLSKMAFICEFQHTSLREIYIFSMFHISCGYKILWTCT